MKITNGMILAAGFGKRMHPLTLKTPKPLLLLHKKTLLERSIELLIDNGINKIVINTHYLADQIKTFVEKKNYNIKIIISDEQQLLLDTGGGVYQGTKVFKNNPFLVINPDTLWRKSYSIEFKKLEKLYFKEKKSCLLLVNKKLIFNNSFKGDFNLKDNIVSRDITNQYVFTGLQILDKTAFDQNKEKVFSMNKVWDELISNKKLLGIQSNQKFYHLNTKEMFDKISNLKIID